ncbi:spore coat associated protein CotJA [Blautia obeum]|uniref:spore coat associated protein CotJA n=1 Tax=Blautia obeum TaxID=40520 RepID=UPI001FB87B90|nr:spore coat associated protein CotJA [Blautia obeum]
MEIYQTSRPCGRPYNATCGMAREMMGNQPCSCRPSPRNQRTPSAPCPSCRMPSAPSRDSEMYTHIDEMQIAMAYVPCQKFSTTYDLGYALNVGTVFPELCKPFCGKRGGRR